MKKKILIVEDDRRLLNLYQMAIEKSFDVILAYNGKEAVEMAASQLPDLILMDVMMPQMDGFDALTQLKGNPITASIPVILLTARSEHEEVLAGYKTGADYYITKPFTRKGLLYGINLVLGKREDVDPPVPHKSPV